jgi:hypothetical protein
MSRPHKISVAEMETFLASHYVEAASATTVDQTQRKRFGRSGTGLYLVERRYLETSKIQWSLEEVGEWQPIYAGPDLAEAVRMYNGLG